MEIQQLLKSRFIVVVLAAVFAVVAFVTFRLYMQKREVDSEVKRLQAQASELNQSNEQLSELIKYLGTQEFKEKEAREKLNLKKEGEHVVVLPDSNEQIASLDEATSDNTSNLEKWFDYFFKPQ